MLGHEFPYAKCLLMGNLGGSDKEFTAFFLAFFSAPRNYSITTIPVIMEVSKLGYVVTPKCCSELVHIIEAQLNAKLLTRISPI